jgi:four helix bundle protein
MKYQKFEELPVWQLSFSLTKDIYNLTTNNKFNKDYSLKDQIRRAAISISSNISEGFERNNVNEFIRYLKIAKGSCGEARNQLHISASIDYVSQKEFERLNSLLLNLSSQIGGFIKYLQQKRRNREFSNK